MDLASNFGAKWRSIAFKIRILVFPPHILSSPRLSGLVTRHMTSLAIPFPRILVRARIGNRFKDVWVWFRVDIASWTLPTTPSLFLSLSFLYAGPLPLLIEGVHTASLWLALVPSLDWTVKASIARQGHGH